jgi:glutamate formiminotransferase/formiminotetrahydrofolate cyclodeaminase
MGLADVAPFDPVKKVLGLPRVPSKGLMAMVCADFVDEVSRDTPAPGGGSIAALSGALGAALAAMVANLALGRKGDEDRLLAAAETAQRAKDRLVLAVDEDTSAFNAYMEARRLPQGTPGEKAGREAAMQQGLKAAVAVPWSTAQACFEVLAAADLAMRHGNPASITDAMQGVQMGFAGLRGGIWNVMINLKDITDGAFRAEMQANCAELLARARALAESATAYGDAALEKLHAGGKP